MMASSQVGKTEVAINNPVGYFIDQDPSPILVVQPTLESARSWSMDRLAPMLRDSPQLRGRVRDPRTRDPDNTILHKVFPGGHITIVGANSAAGLAMRPIRILLCDEIDRYPPSAGTEGDPVSLGRRRTQTFWNRKEVLCSSPTIKGNSRIEEAYEQSDQRQYHVPCPHCKQLQVLEWKFMHWDEGKPETAVYICRHCGAVIDETNKLAMLERGKWVARKPGARTAGFHINALYSPWARWSELAAEFLDVKASPERLKVFVNTILAEPWEELAEEIDTATLAKRREDYGAEVPAGVGVLTCSCDVQIDRLEVEVRGWGAGEESWLIAHHRIFGDPERAEVWQRFEAIRTKPYKHSSGKLLRVRCTAVDSGAFTHSVYRYVAPRQRAGVWAIKGSSERGRALLGRRPAKANRQGVRLWSVGTDTGKDVLFLRLKMLEPGPGYLHFPQPQPDGADDEYLLQFGAEKAVTRFRKGVRIREYVRVRDRNEAIDLYCYSLAALHILGRGVTEHLDKHAAAANETPAPPPAEGEPPADEDATEPEKPRERRRHGRGGWVNKWRP